MSNPPSVKIAGVQMDIRMGDPAANLEAMRRHLATTTSAGAALTVFPECTTTGYCFDSRDEAAHVAETTDGETMQAVAAMCAELKTLTVFGFLERDGDRIFNALAVVGPNGRIAGYRKIHLPFLGVDRFITPGDCPFEVVEVAHSPELPLRIGMNTCYDISFPESARVLALAGADLIVLPTNWPPGAGLTADVIPNARALENHVYFMSVNRVGTERGIPFVGKSKICDPKGNNLAFADHDQEAILYADIDPAFARQKHLVNIPNVHEVHRINDRRPDMYGPISDSRPVG
jgi:predicted amidohydrolase